MPLEELRCNYIPFRLLQQVPPKQKNRREELDLCMIWVPFKESKYPTMDGL